MPLSVGDDALLRQLHKLIDELSDWLVSQELVAPEARLGRTPEEFHASADRVNRHSDELRATYANRFALRVLLLTDLCESHGVAVRVNRGLLERPALAVGVRQVVTILVVLADTLESRTRRRRS